MGETTFERYKDVQPSYYCKPPTIDVEILPRVYVCNECERPIHLIPMASENSLGRFAHDDRSFDHLPIARPVCSFCGTNERGVVKYKMMADSDQLHCSRCGGIEAEPFGM